MTLSTNHSSEGPTACTELLHTFPHIDMQSVLWHIRHHHLGFARQAVSFPCLCKVEAASWHQYSTDLDKDTPARGQGAASDLGAAEHASVSNSDIAGEQPSLVQQLLKSSPTGKLLDAFSADAQVTAEARGAAAQAEATTSTSGDGDMVRVILQAVQNCKPLMKVQSVKAGTKVVYIPKVVHPAEQRSLAIRWIVDAAKKRKQNSKSSMAECLSLELLLAYRKEGAARQKRDELHKLALDNRANVQMKWW